MLSYQLYEAVNAENIGLAQQLIEAGADVNYRTPSTKNDGEACFVAAIRTDNFAMVELLLNHGANPNVEAYNLQSPLTIAIAHENIRIVDTLIKHNVDINYPYETDLDTPMMGAIREDQDAILQLLISRGADPYKRNKDGENLFAFAKRWNYPLPPELVEEPRRSLFHVMGNAIKKRFGRK